MQEQGYRTTRHAPRVLRAIDEARRFLDANTMHTQRQPETADAYIGTVIMDRQTTTPVVESADLNAATTGEASRNN